MKRVNLSILWQFFTRFGAALFNLLIGVLMSQFLGSEGRGTQGLFLASVALVHLFGGWLGGSSLVYLAPRYSLKQLASISFLYSTLFSMVCWIFIYSIGLMPEHYEWPILIISLVFVWWNNLSNLLLGISDTKRFNTLQLIHPIITGLVLLLFFLLFDAVFEHYILAYGLAQLINLMVSVGYLRKQFANDRREKDKALFRTFLKHGFYIQLANVTQFLNYRILYFLIDHYFGKSFLGIYSNALTLAESVWMITRSISTVQFAKIANSQNNRFNRKLTRHYAFISFMVSSMGIGVLLILPDTFFVWLFGDEFAGMRQIISWLAPAILFMAIGNIYAHYFAGRGENKVNFLGSALNLLVLLGVFFLSKDLLNELAAPISVSFSFLIGMIYHLFRFKFAAKSKQI